MTEEELAIEQRAIAFAKAHRTEIAREIACKQLYPGEEAPISVFMAGSPGAGKTEVSKELIGILEAHGVRALRIDPDDFRSRFPEYTGTNSKLFQKAVTTIVERVHDLVLQQRQSFLLDGTLANFKVATRNIERSLAKGRSVQVVYVYQRPELAWDFVVAREITEGRNIPCAEFVRQFFSARDTVRQLKKSYGADLHVDVIVKDNDGKASEIGIDLDCDGIDALVNHTYDPVELEHFLTEAKP